MRRIPISTFVLCCAVWIAALGDDSISNAASFEQGRRLFFDETFRGNGRTCATCHRVADEFTVTPETAQRLFDRDPADPLFRPIDSNDGQGRDYTNLLQHALVRVTVPLHDDVLLVDNPTRRTIQVWRGVPSISNVALTAPYMQDGRAGTLQQQALGAIRDHFEPSRTPLSKELDSLALYQQSQFYPLRLGALADGSETPPPAGFSIPLAGEASVRGRVVFDRHCLECHGGETRHDPQDPHQPQIDTVFVSEANRLGLEPLRLAFRNPDGSITEVETPDPGRAAVTGRLADLNKFDTPPLRGLKHGAPYFHDNSSKTLEEVVDHYNEFFPFGLSEQQKRDLIAYLEAL